MAEAGSDVKLYVLKAQAGAAVPANVAAMEQICGIESFQQGRNRISLDKTDFKSGGVKEYFNGLKEGTLSMDGFYVAGDAGQADVEEAYDGDADAILQVVIAPTGTVADGTDCFDCVVESIEISAEVAGRVEYSVGLNVTGPKRVGPTT